MAEDIATPHDMPPFTHSSMERLFEMTEITDDEILKVLDMAGDMLATSASGRSWARVLYRLLSK